MDPDKLEEYSSALTLADMEIFVFPELMYCLVLANIMSPIIWRWRDEDCFRRLEGKSPYKKLLRLRQYIMDEYDFNLDLQTWGLTRKDVEMKRFAPFIPPEEIARSNALFGYEGDKYYFDVDIRRHFGLDKYDGDVIPYWKTETVEAMNAFRHKAGYNTGAGECVSLSSLYAAAAFVVCGVSLDDLFMVLTPLHSQNFIDLQDGVLTNNRRLVTKAMWFNGTEISNKAQRALRNEQVTIVAHNTGYVHCLYPDATIDAAQYRRCTQKLAAYLTADLDALMFANFLRSSEAHHKHFQFCRILRGHPMFVKAEVLFGYEHGSKFRIADMTFDKLLDEVSSEDYSPYRHEGRLCCEQLMAFIREQKIDVRDPQGRRRLAVYLAPIVPDSEKFVEELYSFLHVEPKLPAAAKNYIPSQPIQIRPEWDRQQIIDYLQGIRRDNVTADLAFYAYRDMESCDWQPFIKAALERSPVSIEMCRDRSLDEIYARLREMPDESIYDGKRLAQPDEVANYQRGDGIEKAFTLANVIRHRDPQTTLAIDIAGPSVTLHADRTYSFSSTKSITRTLSLSP